MNLKTVTEVRRVSGNEEIDWREGDGWMAGGTWLFSEPQPHLHRLLDLQGSDGECPINPASETSLSRRIYRRIFERHVV